MWPLRRTLTAHFSLVTGWLQPSEINQWRGLEFSEELLMNCDVFIRVIGPVMVDRKRGTKKWASAHKNMVRKNLSYKFLPVTFELFSLWSNYYYIFRIFTSCTSLTHISSVGLLTIFVYFSFHSQATGTMPTIPSFQTAFSFLIKMIVFCVTL